MSDSWKVGAPFPVLPFGLKSYRWGMGWRKPGVSLVRMRLRPRSVQVGLCASVDSLPDGTRYSCFGLWGEKGNARGSRRWAQISVSHFFGTRARGSAIKLESRGGWLRGMRR